jgi:hypothetical protein
MMGIKPHYHVDKTYLIHPATVRAFLKKKGYSVGHWSTSGRISGLSNFFGIIEVKEGLKVLSYDIINKYLHKEKTEAWVILEFWNETSCIEKPVDKEKLLQDLTAGGFLCEKEEKNISNHKHLTIIIKGKTSVFS